MAAVLALCVTAATAAAASQVVQTARRERLPEPPRPRPEHVPPAPITVAPIAIGPWNGHAQTTPHGHRLLHCIVEGTLSGGITLAIRITRDGEAAMAFTAPNWALPAGMSFPWQPSAGPALNALVVARNRIAVPVGSDIGQLARILGQGWIVVPYPGGSFETSVPHGRAVVEALRGCVEQALAQESESASVVSQVASRPRCPAPRPQAAEPARPGFLAARTGQRESGNSLRQPAIPAEGEFGSFMDRAAMRLVLDLAGLERAEAMPDNLLAADYPGALQGWRLGAVVGLASVWRADAGGVRAVTGEGCGGGLEISELKASGMAEKDGGGPVHRFVLRCRSGRRPWLMHVSLTELAGDVFAVSHCGEPAEASAIADADAAMARFLTRAVNGWAEVSE